MRDAFPGARRGAALSRTVVIGVGNVYRRDDGVGLAVVEALRDRVGPDVELVSSEQEPSRLIHAWEGADVAVVVDAIGTGGEAGTVHRFDGSGAPIPDGVFRSSTHAFGVGEAVEIARALETLPPRVVVYGVEGADFGAGEGLTPAVGAAVGAVADAIVRELEEAPCTSAR